MTRRNRVEKRRWRHETMWYSSSGFSWADSAGTGRFCVGEGFETTDGPFGNYAAAASQGQGSRARSSPATLRRDDRSACEEPERYFRGWYLSIGSAGVWLLLQFRRGRVPAASNGEGGENQWYAKTDPALQVTSPDSR